MKETLERLVEMIWYLTLNFGKDHPESFIPEDIIIEDNIIYNCSYGILVYDIGEKIWGVGDVRLQTQIDDETLYIKVYTGRVYDSPDKLVFSYKTYSDQITLEWEFEIGDWERMILKEYELNSSFVPKLNLPFL